MHDAFARERTVKALQELALGRIPRARETKGRQRDRDRRGASGSTAHQYLLEVFRRFNVERAKTIPPFPNADRLPLSPA
jgi:hypothetical protein